MFCKKFLAALFIVVLSAIPSSAKFLWQDYSLTILSGNEYKVGDKNQTIFTFEHAGETEIGDSFLFYDHSRWRNGKVDHYGEWTTRYSITKLTNGKKPKGLISDYFVTSCLEMGNNMKNSLYGIGINLNIKPFSYFKIDYYRRINDNSPNNWQTTIVWGLPFNIGDAEFVYDGFLDKTTSTSRRSADMNFTSQLKWNISPYLKIKNKLYLGIEYVHWDNKYGIKHSSAFPTNERNVNALLQYHF